MKVEDLKKELTAKIKNLIFEVLKDFDMSKYKIDICILDNECYITILKENIYITTIQYKNENYSFFMIYVFDNVFFNSTQYLFLRNIFHHINPADPSETILSQRRYAKLTPL